jgi:hypothetical protein
MFAVSINFNCVPKLRASGLVRESPALGQSVQISSPSSKPDRSPLSSPLLGYHPLTPGSHSSRIPRHHSTSLVGDFPLSPPFSKPDRRPSHGSRPSSPTAFDEPNHHPSVPAFFSKSIRYPSDTPFSKPDNGLLAARVSEPTHSASISLQALASSSKPHNRPPMASLTYPSQSNSQSSPSQFVAPSSLRVPSFSKPGSKASAPSSPSKSNFKPRMARDVMSIRKDTPAVIAQL